MAFKKPVRRRKATSAKRTSVRKASTRRSKRVKIWSMSEVSKLRKAYRNTTNGNIAKSLGRSVASVRAKAGALNLKKNKNFLSLCAKSAGNGSFPAKKSPRRGAAKRRSSVRRSSASRSARKTTRRAAGSKRRSRR